MGRKSMEESSNYEPIGEVDDAPISERDVENSLDFEDEFIKGRSWFELHRQDPSNAASTSFVARFEEKPEEGWQRFIQVNYADRELKTSKWRIWLKQGINPRTGGPLSKQGKTFAVEPSADVLRSVPQQMANYAGTPVIMNNIPQQPQQQANEFNKMAAETVNKILEKAIAEKTNPSQTLEDMVKAVKAINDLNVSKEPVAPVLPQPDTSMEKALLLFKTISEAIPKPKDDTRTILELLQAQNKIVQTYETKLREAMLDNKESSVAKGNPLDLAVEQLDKTLALAERLGYTKGDGAPQKDSTDKWIDAIQEGIRVAGPSIAQLAGGLGALLFSKVSGSQQPQMHAAAPAIGYVAPPAGMQPQPQDVNRAMQPPAMQQPAGQQPAVLPQSAVMELVSLVQAIKVSVSKNDGNKDEAESSMERVLAAIEDMQGQKEKIDNITTPSEMTIYLSDIIDGVANDPNVNNNLFKLSVVMGSMEGQKWKSAFLDFAKSYFFEVEEALKGDEADASDATTGNAV